MHGKWSEWIDYSNCTGSCTYGNNTVYRSQIRTCDNPKPDFGGNKCHGDYKKLIECDLPECDRKLCHVSVTSAIV